MSRAFREWNPDQSRLFPPSPHDWLPDSIWFTCRWMCRSNWICHRSWKSMTARRAASRIVQLAVSKAGIISGTLYNTETDKPQSVQGKVDKDTQRVAMRIGENDKLVVETGLYNLTQQEAPLLVHLGAEKVENWLLVRVDDPAPDDASKPAAQP